MNNRTKHIVIGITEARAVRDLFWNGQLLEKLLAKGYRITIFTEAVCYPPFIKEWEQDGVEFVRMIPMFTTTGVQRRSREIRHKLAKWKLRGVLEVFTKLEQKHVVTPHPSYLDWLREHKPDLVVATHIHLFNEARLVSSAVQLGIPTLGFVKSWDNVYKGINTRPERVMVWNEINKQELIDQEGFRPERIKVIGSPAFDLYFDPSIIWSRERFAEHFGFDPARPILMFATLGQFFVSFDETVWMDLLIEGLERGEIAGNPQILCRLHPLSRLEYFQRYTSHPDVKLSYVDKYIPTLGWYMDRDDVIVMANMLYHCAAVITPGSTVTLEAAIFDKPTIVPIFHTYHPERAEDYYRTWVIGFHFGRIQKNNLTCIVTEAPEYIPTINKALTEPGWYHEGRQQLVRDYATFTDGRATERLVDLATKIAETGTWD